MPKSGTHLLTQVVNLLGYQDAGRHDRLWLKAKDRLGIGTPVVLAHLRVKRQWQRRWLELTGASQQQPAVPVDVTMPVQTPVTLLQAWLNSIPPGHYLSGHLPWTVETADLVRATGLKHLIIVRDPRDVLVSFLHFVTRPEHVLSRDFLSLTPDERLALALEGGVGPRSGWTITGLSQGFASILAWQQEPDVLFLRFEALIGERGDGSRAAQLAAVEAVCQYLGLAADEELVEYVCAHAFDTSAETFRRGKIGSWRDELTPDQIQQCNTSLAAILEALP